MLGDNEGLYMLDITDDGLYKFSDRDIRKVSQIMIIKEEGLIALLAGKYKLQNIWSIYLATYIFRISRYVPFVATKD